MNTVTRATLNLSPPNQRAVRALVRRTSGDLYGPSRDKREKTELRDFSVGQEVGKVKDEVTEVDVFVYYGSDSSFCLIFYR